MSRDHLDVEDDQKSRCLLSVDEMLRNGFRYAVIPTLEFEAADYIAQRSVNKARALTTECASNPA